MQTRLSKTPVPRSFQDVPGLLLERDIGVGRGRLRAKLLVFASRKAMREFWKKRLEMDQVCGRTLGICQEMIQTVETFKGGMPAGRWCEVDPRYFCIIGLIKKYLTMEIITHEANHAGVYYARRSRRSWTGENDVEESIAYPAGRIAAGINRALHKAGLYGEAG